MSHVLHWHPAVNVYLSAKYERVLEGQRETVSVHIRVPTAVDNETLSFGQRRLPTMGWYMHVMEHKFDPTKVVFMIFAESTTALAPLMAAMQSRVSGLEYELVDESCALSLALMSKCKHHVFGASAFGFWGTFDVCDCVRTTV